MNEYSNTLAKYVSKFKLALTILVRVYSRYPYIIEECSTHEEIEELLEK